MNLKHLAAAMCVAACAAACGPVCQAQNTYTNRGYAHESGLGKLNTTRGITGKWPRERRPYFGVRASVGYAYPYHVKYARIPLAARADGVDLAVAGLFHAPFGEHFYLEPQVEAYYSMLRTDHRICQEPAEEGITKADLNTVGFRVPIFAGWRMGLWRDAEISFFTGPEFDFRVYTHFKPDAESKIFDGTWSRPLYGDYGVDLDIRSGVGVSFGRIWVGATYSWGLCRITRSDFGVKRQRIVQATVGYDF